MIYVDRDGVIHRIKDADDGMAAENRPGEVKQDAGCQTCQDDKCSADLKELAANSGGKGLHIHVIPCLGCSRLKIMQDNGGCSFSP